MKQTLALLRDISATLETITGRIEQLEEAEAYSSELEELPEETWAAIESIKSAASCLRRYR